MPETNTLSIEARPERRRRNHGLRAAGKVPAVIYGHGVDSTPVTLPEREFLRAFHKVGRTQLLDLAIDGGKPHRVLVREVQYDARSGRLLHVDFYQVNLKEKIGADVPVVTVGESPAVQRHDGELLQNLSTLHVSCLPTDIPEHFEVDISGLEEVDQAIRVSDITAPEGVEIQTDPEEIVVKVAHIKVVIEEEPVVEEGAEGEEGAAAEGEQAAAAEGESPAGGEEGSGES